MRNAQEAAGYIEVTLTEASDEPKLLQMVLKDVVDSRLKFNNLSESAQLQWEKLDKMVTASAGSEIYCFVELLEALGFKLEISVEDSELSAECTTDRQLLRNAIIKVIEARIRMNALSDSAKQYHKKLDQMLTESAGSEIYCFVELLEALGFKLEITVADIEFPADSESTQIEESQLSPKPANAS